MTELTAFDASALERAGATVTPTSLDIPDVAISYESLENLCSFLGTLNRGCEWWTGDLLLQIEMRYGEKVAQAAEATGLAPQTIMNRISVCKHVPRQRRKNGLSFSVHAEVAYREPDEQVEWLEKAAANRWTRAQLRLAMQAELVQPPGPLTLPPAVGSGTKADELLALLRSVLVEPSVAPWLADAIQAEWSMEQCLQHALALAEGVYV